MTAIALFEQPSTGPVSVADLIRAYTNSLDRRAKSEDISVVHADNCKRDLRNFAAFVGSNKLVDECRQYDLTEWLRANDKNWKSQHTKLRAISAVIGCFRWGADDEEGCMIDRNPYRFPKVLKGKPAEPRRPALESEYLELLRAGSKPLKRALFFLWHTGARTCEMRLARWTDFNYHNRTITLAKHKNVKKTGKARIIPLSQVVADFLRWMQRSSKSAFIFTNCDGQPWTKGSWCQHFRRTCERLGLDADSFGKQLTAYGMRHAYACGAIESGDTHERVADRLGNSAEVVRKIYASHTRQHVGYLTQAAEDDAQRRKKKWLKSKSRKDRM